MTSDHEGNRYVFHTQGVCPPEIHFQVQDGTLKEVRFVGGGCPGNAQLVGRLLQGRPLKEVMELLEDVICRNGTSCPDQLAKGLRAAMEGTLEPVKSFRVHHDSQSRNRIGMIGELGGRGDILETIAHQIPARNVEKIYCLGNLTGNSPQNEELLGMIRKKGIQAILGDRDYLYANGIEDKGLPSLDQKERDYLIRLPQVLSFRIGRKTGMAFYGEYLQDLPGFSDFEPYALEMNMVCELTRFMQDQNVFPAVEAMVPQFKAQVILFGQTDGWGHWRVGGVDFIGVGPAWSGNGSSWGLLAGNGDDIQFEIINIA